MDASPQTDESRIGRSEAARAVELAQVRLVVHVNPVQSTFASDRDGPLDQRATNSAPAQVGADSRFEQERMDSAIPGQLHEADQFAAVVGTDKRQQPLQFGAEVVWRTVIGPRDGVE